MKYLLLIALISFNAEAQDIQVKSFKQYEIDQKEEIKNNRTQLQELNEAKVIIMMASNFVAPQIEVNEATGEEYISIAAVPFEKLKKFEKSVLKIHRDDLLSYEERIRKTWKEINQLFMTKFKHRHPSSFSFYRAIQKAVAKLNKKVVERTESCITCRSLEDTIRRDLIIQEERLPVIGEALKICRSENPVSLKGMLKENSGLKAIPTSVLDNRLEFISFWEKYIGSDSNTIKFPEELSVTVEIVLKNKKTLNSAKLTFKDLKNPSNDKILIYKKKDLRETFQNLLVAVKNLRENRKKSISLPTNSFAQNEGSCYMVVSTPRDQAMEEKQLQGLFKLSEKIVKQKSK